MPKLFGTDGVRGIANAELTPDLALTLGRAAATVLARGGQVVVGRDTRMSGPMLEAALVAGLCSAGADALVAGIVPSPAVAWLTRSESAAAGAVVSASHNPVDDNGIKFFSEHGTKLTADVEDAIEALLERPSDEPRPRGADVGGPFALTDATDSYLDHLASLVDASLDGLVVVLDCAHGATFEVAPRAFEKLGARVVPMHTEPDGARINVGCGSTSMQGVADRVVAERAHLGFGFDGDGDRVLAVDDRGEVCDGDRIVALLALSLHAHGALAGDVVVSTVMSNLGFRRALEASGIEVVTAPVGDKYVVEEMLSRGAVLGGEQSGHVVFGEHPTTGDGILTALQVAACVASDKSALRAAAELYEPWPQVLVNVPVRSRDALDGAGELWAEVAASERELGDDGRVLVRASGTEPVVRVMVEAHQNGAAQRHAQRLADAVARHLG